VIIFLQSYFVTNYFLTRVWKAIKYLTRSEHDYREYPVCSLLFMFLIVFVICPYICVLFISFPVNDIQIHIDIIVLPLYQL